jgi:hypothetical protein
MTTTNYVLKLMAQIKHLTPPMEERDLVYKVARHFSERTRVATTTRGVDTLEKFIMVVEECQDLERDLQRVNHQQGNYPRDSRQEPTFHPTRRRDNERQPEKRYTPYHGNRPQYRQEIEDKGRSRSVETRPNKGLKVCNTTISTTEPQPSTSRMDPGN